MGDPGPAILVSACLLGEPCRWDGTARPSEAARAALRGARVVAVCPERAGGLPVPRIPCELRGGDGAAVLRREARVVDRDGTDRTDAFLEGARRSLAAAPDATRALLKARSPSCGRGRIWQDGRLVPGDGVFAALLGERGVEIVTEEDLAPPSTAP